MLIEKPERTCNTCRVSPSIGSPDGKKMCSWCDGIEGYPRWQPRVGPAVEHECETCKYHELSLVSISALCADCYFPKKPFWQPRVYTAAELHPARHPPHPGKRANEERQARGWTDTDTAHLLNWLWGRWMDFRDGGSFWYPEDKHYADLARVFGTTPGLWRSLYENWRDWPKGDSG